mmetsp:Transcript_28956/g.78423  ORF Transcript_28956/g.78423 Transcript_28956/m.78423 type:complete len:611 (-) Transcript_28956:9-1841(-)
MRPIDHSRSSGKGRNIAATRTRTHSFTLFFTSMGNSRPGLTVILFATAFAVLGVVHFQKIVRNFDLQNFDNFLYQNTATEQSVEHEYGSLVESSRVSVIDSSHDKSNSEDGKDERIVGPNDVSKGEGEDEKGKDGGKDADDQEINAGRGKNEIGGDEIVGGTSDKTKGKKEDGRGEGEGEGEEKGAKNEEDSRNDDNSTPSPKQHKFFILSPPELTSSLVESITEPAVSDYYRGALNEDSAEMWLHRAFQSLSYEDGRTLDPSEADVFLLAGYFHLNLARGGDARVDNKRFGRLYANKIIEPSKPHLLLVPATNPVLSRKIGIQQLVRDLSSKGVNLWSVGFERNDYWQRMDLRRVIPIPYVVKSDQLPETTTDDSKPLEKIKNSVFYAGDMRQNAMQWAGCDRNKTISSLQSSLHSTDAQKLDYDVNNIDVRVIPKRTPRLPQDEYNRRMSTSEYCLILCGDTPSSRSLTSAMVAGCIPLFVGSRLRGLCEPPCSPGWGWRISGAEYPHLPHGDYIPWETFPEVNEQNFIDDGAGMLDQVFRKFHSKEKDELRRIMQQAHRAWIYGKGNPVTSTDFGDVHKYAWDTFQRTVFNETSSSASSFISLPVLN